MLILRMALRNLRRNLRRTLITGLAIGFGLALLVVSSGIADGVHAQMIRSGVSAMAGHLVVQGRGYAVSADPQFRHDLHDLLFGGTDHIDPHVSLDLVDHDGAAVDHSVNFVHSSPP